MNKLETGLFKSVWPFSEHQALNSSSYLITNFVEGNDFHKHDFEYIFCLTVWIDGYFRLTFATTTRTTKILQPFFDALFFSTKVFLVFIKSGVSIFVWGKRDQIFPNLTADKLRKA